MLQQDTSQKNGSMVVSLGAVGVPILCLGSTKLFGSRCFGPIMSHGHHHTPRQRFDHFLPVHVRRFRRSAPLTHHIHDGARFRGLQQLLQLVGSRQPIRDLGSFSKHTCFFFVLLCLSVYQFLLLLTADLEPHSSRRLGHRADFPHIAPFNLIDSIGRI